VAAGATSTAATSRFPRPRTAISVAAATRASGTEQAQAITILILAMILGVTSWSDRALAALERQGRSGGARRAVVELLGRQDCCLTAQEIFDRLRAEGGRRVGIATVYRVLEQLSERGLVQRVDVDAGTARYEAALPTGEHHHHLVCADCGKVEAFADDELEAVIHKVERRTGYSVAGHDVVLRGACRECAA
jgi:Fur family transcriptional regulator, ferric uptake regulator